MAATEHKERKEQFIERGNTLFENDVYRLCDAETKGSYRYYLRGEILNTESKRHLVVVQLNPSKANGSRSDATAGKVCNWAARNDFAVVHFLNLFARIATIQGDVESDTSYEELVGSENNRFMEQILESIPRDSCVVIGCGRPRGFFHTHYPERISKVGELLSQHHIKQVFCVGPLSNGRFPRHGRAWNKDVGLEIFSFPSNALN